MKLRASLGVGLRAHSVTDRKEGGDHQGMTVVCITMSVCLCVCTCARVCVQSCPPLCDSMDRLAHQTPLSMSMGFSRQQYLSGLPLPPPGDLPNPGTESVTLASPALAGGFLSWESPLGCYTERTQSTVHVPPAHAKQAS